MTEPGERLAAALADRYRIERELGQGGMATVYLAEDLKHNRKVAIKVLRREVAAVIGAERFLREIRTTANLQHPHILSLFDSGVVSLPGVSGDPTGRLYYVMPYVEGESLRDRLAREKQLPVADAVRIATEVAGALDYAHRRGIVHRDIKPENILLQDGSALVADFGIALAVTTAGGSRITESGFSIGTPQYMSPEQGMAEREISNRSDIFALGCVTYEMLVGNPPFTGISLQAIMARVMTEQPASIRQVRDRVTPAVEEAVFTALAKSPADRFASAAQYASALTNPGNSTPTGTSAAPGVRQASSPVKWPMVALGVLALLAAWGWLRPKPATTRNVPARVTIPIAPDRLLALEDKAFDISPDGSQIVYVGESEGRNVLFLRPLADFEARPLQGTDGASGPFFSPDGQWIGFAAGGKLKKVLRTGGAPIELASIGGTWGGGVWRRDGTIFYANAGNVLYRIPEAGGTPAPIELKASPSPLVGTSRGAVRSPSLLPDGEHALVSIDQSVAAVTLSTGETRTVVAGRSGLYLPTGHLLFDETEGRMRLVRFDPEKLAIDGSAVPAFEAFRSPGGGPAQVAVSANGTLVYVAGGFNRTLVRVDRNGRESPLPFPPRGYRFPRLSPDGLHLAVTIDPRPSQIWVIDLAKTTSIPVTSAGHNIAAVWSPSGNQLAFTHSGFVTQWARWPFDHVIHTVEPMVSPPGLYAHGWTRTHGLTGQVFDTGGRSIVSYQLSDSLTTRLSPPDAGEWEPETSRDDAWLAYASVVTGPSEVYVRPFAGGEAVQISNGGGVEPRWSADDHTLYYRHGSHIMAVPVQTHPRFETLGPAREVLAGSYDFSQEDNWDLAPDGSIILVRGDPASIGKFMVVTNWFDEIRAAGP